MPTFNTTDGQLRASNINNIIDNSINNNYEKIVLGTTCQFNDVHTNNACIAMIVAAFALDKYLPIINWEREELDFIVKCGKTYYRNWLAKENLNRTQLLDPKRLHDNISIGRGLNYKITAATACGEGKISSEELNQALINFEKCKSTRATLTHAALSYGVLRYQRDKKWVYVFYDSHGRNRQGKSIDPRASNGKGCSAILVFPNASELIKFYVGQFDTIQGTYTLVPVNVSTIENSISNLNVVDYNCKYNFINVLNYE